MKKLFLSLFGMIWFLLPAMANDGGYAISVTIDGFKEKQLFLGYYLGDKQYIKDTVSVRPDGSFLFEGAEELDPGMYLVVLPPNNDFFQVLINPGEQHFSLRTKAENPGVGVKVKGSTDNVLFNEYLAFIADRRPKANELNGKLSSLTDEAEIAKVEAELEKLDQEVEAYQQKLLRENPKTLTAAIVRANISTPIPTFEGETEEDKQRQAFYFARAHYFDNIDLADPRMLRTPFLFDRVTTFVDKMQVQMPDSLNVAIDQVLTRMRKAPETFRFFVVHFLNNYATSKYVGMDAVYVHLVENYYANGAATWIDAEQLKKIVDNAAALKPILLGKRAPEIKMQLRDGSPISLGDVQSPYTVLYFWRYDCGHCKESTPYMKAFYENYKDQGVKIFGVCVKFNDEVPDCWKYIDENALDGWIHTVDPYLQSKFYTKYNIKTTPQIFILDKDKNIISKGIGANQIEEVMEQIIQMDKEKNGRL